MTTTPTTSGSTTHATSPAPAANPGVATAVIMLSSLPPVLPPVPPHDPVEDWAGRINAAVGEGVGWFLDAGTLLIEAKAALGHGRWLELFDSRQIRVSLRSAEMLMKIAGHQTLSNAKYISSLPATLTALHALSTGDAEVIEAGIHDGAIRPQMSAAQARVYVRSHSASPDATKHAVVFNSGKRLSHVQQALFRELDKWPGETAAQLADLLEEFAKGIRTEASPTHQ